MKFNYIIYHKKCIDGYVGLFCFYYAKLLTKDARILPDVPSASHAPSGVEGKDVVIVDVAYTKYVLDQILKLAKSVLFVDHHVTNIEEIKKIKSDKLTIFYDVNKSGASLAWNYCFKNEKVPQFIKLVEDNDIGKWEIPNSRSFVWAFRINFDITHPKAKNLKKIEKLLDKKYLTHMIDEGKMYDKYREYLLKESIQGKYTIKKFKFDNKIYRVAVSNIASPLASDVVTALSKIPNIDFSMGWTYNHDRKMFVISLRSLNVDVSTIAKSFGGGGHEHASSFSTKTFIDNLFM